jgi:hypothetical protein
MDGAAFIVIESAAVAVLLALSVTFAVKFEAPVAVGVPVIAPVEVTRDSPAGRLPVAIAQVYGLAPPVAASIWLYATLIVSAGRLDVVIVNGAMTAMDSACVAAAPTLSVTFAVKLDVPVAVGVPVIAPVAAVRLKPPGRLPADIDQVMGAVPPEDVIV